jgi:CBS domain-containing protein
MAEHQIHSVVVGGFEAGRSGRRAWGIVSHTDLLKAAGTDMDARTAREVAATELLTIGPTETLERATQLMVEHEVTHLVVVDPESDLPIGVLSTLDIAGALARVES